ncbi:MAG: hypothetical protein AB1646_11215 [Thermodesulfobacteriota bacterium]
MAEDAGRIQNPEDPPTPQANTSATRPSLARKIFRGRTIVPLILGIAAVGIYLGFLGTVPVRDAYVRASSLIRSSPLEDQRRPEPAAPPLSAFKDSSGGTLISPQTLLKLVGRTPGEPSRVLFSALERAGRAHREDGAGKAGHPDTQAQAPDTEGARPAEAVSGSEAVLESGRQAAPAVVPRGPRTEGSAEPPDDKSPRATSPEPASTPEPRSAPDHTDEEAAEPDGSSTTPRASATPPPIPGQKESGQPKALDEPAARPDNFQLPGSLVVSMPEYQGTQVRWGLLVILDNGAEMGVKSKAWTPHRMPFASDLVLKVAKSLTPGSKIAVRDFLCAKSSGSEGAAQKPCPSHKLYEASQAPFGGLSERLDRVKIGGINNPCAAAAFAVKADLPTAGGLVPRILVVTTGARKCVPRDAVKAITESGSKARPAMDVITMGNPKKTAKGYKDLAAKTGGTFIRIEKPADLHRAVTEYKKILSARMREKIEVRGDKAVFHVFPNEEVTLAPGSYTIVLPPVMGLQASHREIRKVKIESDHSSVLEVKIRKGRPSFKIGRK